MAVLGILLMPRQNRLTDRITQCFGKIIRFFRITQTAVTTPVTSSPALVGSGTDGGGGLGPLPDTKIAALGGVAPMTEVVLPVANCKPAKIDPWGTLPLVILNVGAVA